MYKRQSYIYGCSFSWKTGITSGIISLFVELPDKLMARTFTIPETTIGTLTTSLYSSTAGNGIVGDVYVMSSSINLPAITINIPERCYTTLSGNTITFKNDIDASAVTTTGSPAIDSKSITLNARCHASYLSKNVYASVKLVQMSGVEDNYKFQFTPKKNDYGLSRTLSVVARHLSAGSTGAKTCDKDNNTMENNTLYHVGLVSFKQSNGSLNDPYPITFNLCAFRPEGSSELLPPGEYSGVVRVVTRFYTADN